MPDEQNTGSGPVDSTSEQPATPEQPTAENCGEPTPQECAEADAPDSQPTDVTNSETPDPQSAVSP